MAEKDTSTEGYLVRARELVAHLEAGNVERADTLLETLSGMRESTLFQELGRLTRTLHEALTSFQMDSRLGRLAEQDIPDAHDRLRYVVAKTEEAAHRTLKAVEDSIPLAKRLEQRAVAHQQQWEKFLRREMDIQEFRSLTHSLREFLAAVIADSTNLSRNLSDVLMAQEYQDLTGQVINRVIRVVQEVETSLVDMIRVVGLRAHSGERSTGAEAKTRLEGPQIDPKKPDVVANQDDVDTLLSSLGF